MPSDNAYMKEYMLRRYHKRRNEAIKILGGECAKCGSKDSLEIDHIDPDRKEFDLSGLWSISIARYLDELKKCQLLCKDCHSTKSIYDRGLEPAKDTHGTLSAYRYCRCDKCKEAKRIYTKQRRSRSKRLKAIKARARK